MAAKAPFSHSTQVLTDKATERAEKVSTLFRRGKTHAQIAEILGVCTRTVSRDLVRCREMWREKASQSYELHLHEQLAKIDEAERAAWEGWERSIRDEKITVSEDGMTPKGPIAKVRVERRTKSGQPAFIQVIEKLITLRCRLLGLLDQNAIDEGKPDDRPVVSIVVNSREEAQGLREMSAAEYQRKLLEAKPH